MQVDSNTLRILEETYGDFQVSITEWDENQLTFRFGSGRQCNILLLRKILKDNKVKGHMTENWYEDEELGNRYYYVLKNFQY